MAFYRFARAADDVADHPSLEADQKLAMLDGLGDALSGRGLADPEAEPLRLALDERGLPPRHAFDLLDAFRLDVHKRRYANWQELMDYCRLSAMPVGRFVLDVHGEEPTTWRASDPLCAALQVINHLQDCAKDYRQLDRVYLPQETLAAHGASTAMLAEARSSPALLGALHELAGRTAAMLRDAAPLSGRVGDTRLSLEIAAIHALAERLVGRLASRRSAQRRRASRQGGLRGRRRPRRPAGPGLDADASARGQAECRPMPENAAQDAPAVWGSSFYLAMRILPQDRRNAMFALYSFCRTVDDIADGPGPSAERMADLERWRAGIDGLFAARPPANFGDLAEAVRRFGLRQADFDAVIDGMAMDAADDMRAPDWATLDLYCDRVASAVGRLSVRIFGMRVESGEALAHHLGRALQLTTSCETSTRTPRSAGSICRARR